MDLRIRGVQMREGDNACMLALLWAEMDGIALNRVVKVGWT